MDARFYDLVLLFVVRQCRLCGVLPNYDLLMDLVFGLIFGTKVMRPGGFAHSEAAFMSYFNSGAPSLSNAEFVTSQGDQVNSCNRIDDRRFRSFVFIGNVLGR